MTIVLETRGLVKRFGGITATNDVTLKVETGARLALIYGSEERARGVVKIRDLRERTERDVPRGDVAQAVGDALLGEGEARRLARQAALRHVQDRPLARRRIRVLHAGRGAKAREGRAWGGPGPPAWWCRWSLFARPAATVVTSAQNTQRTPRQLPHRAVRVSVTLRRGRSGDAAESSPLTGPRLLVRRCPPPPPRSRECSSQSAGGVVISHHMRWLAAQSLRTSASSAPYNNDSPQQCVTPSAGAVTTLTLQSSSRSTGIGIQRSSQTWCGQQC